MRALPPRIRELVLSALLVALGCGNPPVQVSADRLDAPPAAPLSGQVIVEGPARGNVLVFLYDAANPPPPVGFAAPVSFIEIPAAQVFGAALDDGTQSGPFSADFIFPQVTSGTWLVAAMLDGQSCYVEPGPGCSVSDFDPFYDVTREPNGFDELGGHVDASNNLLPVVVPPASADGFIHDVPTVQVVLGQAVPDRPAFKVTSSATALSTTAPTPLMVAVNPISLPPVVEEEPIFLLRYVDENHDGIPDLGPDGVPLLWPKVFLRKVQEPQAGSSEPLLQAGLRDENDPNNTGVLSGSIVYPPSTTPSAAILPTAYLQVPPPADPSQALVPTQLFAQLADANGQPDVNKVVYLQSLDLAVLPAAYDISNPTQPVPLASVPAGRYAIYVEQFTGQTWRIPNELAPSLAPAIGFTALPGQDLLFTWGM